MTITRWWAYVEKVTDGAGGTEIARKVQFDPSAITRWKKGENPRWDFVVKFARAYNRNVLEALTEAGFITDEEAKLREVRIGTEDLSTEELLEEALKRVREPKTGH